MGAFTLSIGLLCVWPFGLFAIGFFLGRRGFRVRSPFIMGETTQSDDRESAAGWRPPTGGARVLNNTPAPAPTALKRIAKKPEDQAGFG